MKFTQFYTGAPVCAPSRCILMTGIHSGKAQIRGNDEWPERGDVRNYRAMIADSTLEGQKPMKAGTPTIASVLKSAGYTTGVVGKWGLGAPHTESVPNKLGFDFFYGYNCQRMAHTYYPVHLWKNDHRVALANDTLDPHRAPFPEGADPRDPASYAMYELQEYSPDVMFDEITNFVDENSDKPFFLYWATPIPHLPLQAPKEWIDYYVKKFGDEDPTNQFNYFPQRYPNATYAAMVSYLDDQIGKLVKQLKELGIYENTLIMFTSDNGPIVSTEYFQSGGPFPAGRAYGKGNVNEAGIRVPLIASWPAVIKPGTVSDHIAAAYDVMPTLAEITGAEVPAEATGLSFLPTLKGKKQKAHEYLYWEFPESGGQMALRMNNFKAMRKDMHNGNLTWKLFDLDKDPAEANDISAEHPDIITKVEEIVKKEHTVSDNARWQYAALGEK
jgi:arylsulfatase